MKNNFKTIAVIITILVYVICFVVVFGFGNNKRTPTPLSAPVSAAFNGTESYIVVGDTGLGTNPQFEVAEGIRYFCNENYCKNAFIAGDVIYNFGVFSINDVGFSQKFEQPYQNVNLPFYISFGNHDYLGCKDCYIEYSNISSKWEMPAYYYEVPTNSDYKFLVINTEEFNEIQDNWLKQKLLENPKAIIIGHKPLETYEVEHHGEVWAGMDLLKNTICNTDVIYISGHSHNLEYNNKIGDCSAEQWISGAGGADLRDQIEGSQSEFTAKSYGFLVVSFEEELANFKFYSSDNIELFSLNYIENSFI